MTGVTVGVSRTTRTIIVMKAKGTISLEDLVNFREAMSEFTDYIETFHASGARLFLTIDRTRLPHDDLEGTWIALEEQVGVVAHDTLGD